MDRSLKDQSRKDISVARSIAKVIYVVGCIGCGLAGIHTFMMISDIHEAAMQDSPPSNIALPQLDTGVK